MSATKCLREEHEVILRVLGFFTKALEQAKTTGDVTHEVFDPFVSFFEGFADHCHHCKEESRLFPALEDAGMPREQGPIAVMLYEHEQGRALVRRLSSNLDAADQGDEQAKRKVLGAGLQFVSLLFSHIQKENQMLFNMADNMLQGEAGGSVLDGYAEEESGEGYRETYTSCSQIVRDLTRIYEEPRGTESPLRVL